MTHRLLGFADGENLVHRFQDMCKDGRKPKPEVIHVKDVLVWHPEIMLSFYSDVTRVSYYQTVVGDEMKLQEVKQRICDVSYSYDYSSSTENDQWRGSLFPRVFKKEGKSSKSKSVDINLTVDMMRYAASTQIDVLFLLSGDGDYLPLIEELGRHGKQVWLGAFSKGLNKNLRFAADEFIDLDALFFE